MKKTNHVTYEGPPVDDQEIFDRLPEPLTALLQGANGYIHYHGGFHVRGACKSPAWHSVRDAWMGPSAFHRLYPDVKPDDIPFAEDSLGDQFLLRNGGVWQLYAETGEVEDLEETFDEFMDRVKDDPGEEIGLHPLLHFQRQGGHLQPGQLLAADPPYCTEEAEDGVTLTAMPAEARRVAHAEFAVKFRAESEGVDA